MNFQRGRVREDPEINLIAMIDVLLVILIFLMITTTYSKFSGLEINLPTADAAQNKEQPNEIKEAPEAARIVAAQVEQVAPGVHAALGDLVPALKPEPPPRDVSGSDIGPVARFPGLPRSHWHRDGREVTVRYEGRADYAAVLDHYARGFTAQGFAQRVISAVPEAEVHEYRKGTDKVMFRISQLPQDKVKATIIAELP